MADQELRVNLTADASGFDKATQQAAKDLEGLRKDVQTLDSESAEIKVDVETASVQRELTDVQHSVDDLDAQSIKVSADVELGRINRDMANLNKVLDGLERRKASPDVDLDITQVLRDEQKVRKALDDLDKRKVEATASIHVDETSTTSLQRLGSSLTELQDSTGGGLPGLGKATAGLSLLGGSAGAAAGPVAALTVAVTGWKTAWDLAGVAADAQTAQLQLTALTGSAEEGAQAFDQLQKFAAKTPFAFDDISKSARSLIAAGVGVEDLNGMLTDLGNTSAALDQPLSEVSGIFQQMLSKGKVSNEEMLQLAERGIPAYQVLADQLGVTVEQVQQLASEGKLGADSITALSEGLGDLFPTAMADQAATLNGQLLTFQDNIEQTKAALGTQFLPTMTEAVEVTNDMAGAMLGAAKVFGDLNEKFAEKTPTHFDLFEGFTPLAGVIHLADVAMDHFTGRTEDAKNQSFGALGAIGGLGGSMAALSTQTEEVVVSTDDLNREYQQLLTNFSLVNEGAIGVNSAWLQLNSALAAFKVHGDGSNKTLQGTGAAAVQAKDRLNAAATAISGIAAAQIDAGRSGQVVFNTFQANKKALIESAVAAGFSRRQVEAYIDTILKTPKRAATEIEVTTKGRGIADIGKQIDNLKDKRVKIDAQLSPMRGPEQKLLGRGLITARAKIDAKIEGLEKEVDRLKGIKGDATIHVKDKGTPGSKKNIDNAAKNRKTDINVEDKGTKDSDKKIDHAARDRKSHIHVSESGSDAANREIDNASRDREAIIRIRTIHTESRLDNPSGSGSGPAGFAAQSVAGPLTQTLLVAAAGTLPASQYTQGSARSPVQRTVKSEPVQLAPRQTPVVVLLDGHEISTQLDLRASRLASVSSVRGRRA